MKKVFIAIVVCIFAYTANSTEPVKSGTKTKQEVKQPVKFLKADKGDAKPLPKKAKEEKSAKTPTAVKQVASKKTSQK